MSRPQQTIRRRADQGGFALLLVFCMAAAVAITLYMEMPRVAFETQRSREQLLIERGEEYKRGIKLYVRKFARYPNNLDDLEKTNNIRFLRKRFKDPLTGKDEWRLIHVGAGGFLTDSLVEKPPDLNAGAAKPDAAADPNAPPPVEQSAMTQRRPSDRGAMPPPDQAGAFPVNPGGPLPPGQMQPGQFPAAYPGQPQTTPSGIPYPGQQQTMPSGVPYPGQQQTMPSGVPYPGQTQTMPSGVPYPGQTQTMPSGVPYPGQTQTLPPGAPFPGQAPPIQPGMPYPGHVQPNQRPPIPVPFGVPQPQPAGTPLYPNQSLAYPPGSPNPASRPVTPPSYPPGVPAGYPMSQGPQNRPTTGNNQAIDLIKNILTNPRPGGMPGMQQGQSGSSFGAGIAGVASTAEGDGIRIYNERSKYKEWEFIYDPKKDKKAMAAMGGGVVGMPASQTNIFSNTPSSSTLGPNSTSSPATPLGNPSGNPGSSFGSDPNSPFRRSPLADDEGVMAPRNRPPIQRPVNKPPGGRR